MDGKSCLFIALFILFIRSGLSQRHGSFGYQSPSAASSSYGSQGFGGGWNSGSSFGSSPTEDNSRKISSGSGNNQWSGGSGWNTESQTGYGGGGGFGSNHVSGSKSPESNGWNFGSQNEERNPGKGHNKEDKRKTNNPGSRKPGSSDFAFSFQNDDSKVVDEDYGGSSFGFDSRRPQDSSTGGGSFSLGSKRPQGSSSSSSGGNSNWNSGNQNGGLGFSSSKQEENQGRPSSGWNLGYGDSSKRPQEGGSSSGNTSSRPGSKKPQGNGGSNWSSGNQNGGLGFPSSKQEENQGPSSAWNLGYGETSKRPQQGSISSANLGSSSGSKRPQGGSGSSTWVSDSNSKRPQGSSTSDSESDLGFGSDSDSHKPNENTGGGLNFGSNSNSDSKRPQGIGSGSSNSFWGSSNSSKKPQGSSSGSGGSSNSKRPQGSSSNGSLNFGSGSNSDSKRPQGSGGNSGSSKIPDDNRQKPNSNSGQRPSSGGQQPDKTGGSESQKQNKTKSEQIDWTNLERENQQSSLTFDLSELWRPDDKKDFAWRSIWTRHRYRRDDDAVDKPEQPSYVCHCTDYSSCIPERRMDVLKFLKHDARDLRLRMLECATKKKICCVTSKPDSGDTQPTCGRRVSKLAEHDISMDGSANYGDYPWVLRLIVVGDTDEDTLCSASLIHNSIALTTASCALLLTGKNVRVRSGEWNVFEGNGKNNRQETTIGKVYLHPEFDVVTYKKDLALLFLDMPFHYNPGVNTICLPTHRDAWDASKCVVVGWTKKSGLKSAVLKQVDLDIVAQGKCRHRDGLKNGLSDMEDPGYLCAHTRKDDPYLGDVGSSLFCPLYHTDGVVQVGYVSNTTPGKRDHKTYTFTDILDSIDWVYRMEGMYAYVTREDAAD